MLCSLICLRLSGFLLQHSEHLGSFTHCTPDPKASSWNYSVGLICGPCAPLPSPHSHLSHVGSLSPVGGDGVVGVPSAGGKDVRGKGKDWSEHPAYFSGHLQLTAMVGVQTRQSTWELISRAPPYTSLCQKVHTLRDKGIMHLIIFYILIVQSSIIVIHVASQTAPRGLQTSAATWSGPRCHA